MMFRGREQARPELGFRLLQKLADDVTGLGFVESQPKQDGRNMIMVIGPHRRAPERKVEAKPAPAPGQSRPVPSPRNEAEGEDPVDEAETPAETSAPAPTDA